MSETTVSHQVKTAYDDFYQNHDEAWRMLGAKYKARHIISVCKGHKFTKVLEVGAGDGSILSFLDHDDFASEIYALEIAENAVEHIRNRNLKNLKEAKKFDGYHIPYEDDTFDLVILSHVLEHVEYERTLLREIQRVSRYQVIEVPIDYKSGVDRRINHFLAYGHINMYTPSALRYLLKSEGMTIIADETFLIPPEVTLFNTYINQKQKKSMLTNLNISIEYHFKQKLSAFFGVKIKEKLANAYAVFCGKADNKLEIF
ncbi:MAG: class I SAM-dependent methyltransferase [Sphingobacteriaceae bacterium]